jgi:hypothetical protein
MIDEGLRSPWPPEVIEAAERFQQGHLIEQPPFFWAGASRAVLWGGDLEDVSPEEADTETAETDLRELSAEERPPYGMITSQTCDIGGASARRYPWIQVAPVYRVEAERASDFAQRHYVARLTAPAFADEGWFVDLRVEFPLEKSILVGRHPIEAFGDEEGYLALARLLGRRRERAALADALVEIVFGGIRDKRRSERNSDQTQRVWPRLQRGGLRLSVVEGSRLEPKQARLHVVTNGPPDDDVRAWFGEWFDAARLLAQDLGFSLLATEFLDGTSVNAEYYRSLIDLGILDA